MNEVAEKNYIHFTHTDQLKGFSTGGNFVAFSELESFQAPMVKRDVIGLKYVLFGEENYVVNGTRHRVKPGQLLVVDELERGEAFNGPGKAIGVCINLDRKLVNEVISSHLNSSAALEWSDRKSPEIFNFFQQATPAAQLFLGKSIKNLAYNLETSPGDSAFFEKDFFHSMVEQLLQDHQQISGLQARVGASKKITRQEICKRLLFAKELMDSCFDQKIEVGLMAAQAGMSEYHFCRMFRSVFGNSPYKYLTQIRLKKAVELLRLNQYPITEIAIKCGFPDIHSFSKAFKKQFLLSPSAFSKN